MSHQIFFIMIALFLMIFSPDLFSRGCSRSRGTSQRDFEAVQGFVNSKRTIPLQEKMGGSCPCDGYCPYYTDDEGFYPLNENENTQNF